MNLIQSFHFFYKFQINLNHFFSYSKIINFINSNKSHSNFNLLFSHFLKFVNEFAKKELCDFKDSLKDPNLNFLKNHLYLIFYTLDYFFYSKVFIGFLFLIPFIKMNRLISIFLKIKFFLFFYFFR
jgi:hypothetical protein